MSSLPRNVGVDSRLTAWAEHIDALRAPRSRAHFPRFDCCADFETVLANVMMSHRKGVPLIVGTDRGNPFMFPAYNACPPTTWIWMMRKHPARVAG